MGALKRASGSRLAMLPGLGVFPGNIDGVIHVKQKSFFAVQEAEPKNVVIDKGCERTQGQIEGCESDWAFCDHHVGSQGRIAIHVFDVVGDCGIGMVDQRAIEPSCFSIELHVFMHETILEVCTPSAKEP